MRAPTLGAVVSLASMALGCTCPAKGAARGPIDAPMVARALAELGLRLDPAQVHFPALLTSASATPRLIAYHAERSKDEHVRVQMKCAKPGDCLAFTVSLDVDGNAAEELMQVVANRHTENPRPVSGASDQARSSDVRSGAPMVQPGQQLTMWLEEGRMHIHLPVIALDRGFQGSTLRVCTSDRRNTFHAVVLDSSTVKGIVE
ncbi:MAG: hypothetical protein NVS9B15_17600 [Acidobacteriaceae bacterium]